MWLREDTEGIGTLTFVTPENQFAALGHGITDADTDLLIRLQNGGLYPAGIDHVVKGKNGTPGQLAGYVQLGKENRLGEIENNTLLGITGQITNRAYQYQEDKACEAACKQDVRKGKAVIRCQLDDQVKEYEVEIEKINLSSKDNKGMEIHVTDPELLESGRRHCTGHERGADPSERKMHRRCHTCLCAGCYQRLCYIPREHALSESVF